ncbi:MAG TPA: hypothetical protein VIP28_03885 [Nocardioides sp.]
MTSTLDEIRRDLADCRQHAAAGAAEQMADVLVDHVTWLLDELDRRPSGWPAMAYVYGTWGYALKRARELATEKQQKTYLYRSSFNGEPCWVVSWDPKPEAGADLLKTLEAIRESVTHVVATDEPDATPDVLAILEVHMGADWLSQEAGR